MRWSENRAPLRRGAATVEMALVLPLILLVVLGAVDFGRFAYTYIAVTNAARAGAAYGAVNPVTSGTETLWGELISKRVAEELDVEAGAATVSATRLADPGAMWRVRVEVTYPFDTIVPWPGIPSHLDLHRTVEMRGIR